MNHFNYGDDDDDGDDGDDDDNNNRKYRNNKCYKPEAATGGVLWKKVFLKISQNSQEHSCVGVSFLIKLHAWGLQHY